MFLDASGQKVGGVWINPRLGDYLRVTANGSSINYSVRFKGGDPVASVGAYVRNVSRIVGVSREKVGDCEWAYLPEIGWWLQIGGPVDRWPRDVLESEFHSNEGRTP